MTTPFYCVFLALLIVYLIKIPVGVAMHVQGRGYDNRHPRDQQAILTGWGKRALAAHLNGFENFPSFAAAVIIAHLAGADPTWSAYLAVAHVICRALYPVLYIGDIHWARSSVWGLGMAATAGLFFLPVIQA